MFAIASVNFWSNFFFLLIIAITLNLVLSLFFYIFNANGLLHMAIDVTKYGILLLYVSSLMYVGIFLIKNILYPKNESKE